MLNSTAHTALYFCHSYSALDYSDKIAYDAIEKVCKDFKMEFNFTDSCFSKIGLVTHY